MAKLKAFRGLNNTADPLNLGIEWCTVADDVDFDESGRVSSRDGFETLETGSFFGAFSTIDKSRAYVVKDGQILERMADKSMKILADGISNERMFFDEINEQVYFNNGVQSGYINRDGSIESIKFDAPPAPSLKTGKGGQLALGLYRVCCTYVLPDGRETGSGEIAEIYVNEGEFILMTTIPQLDDHETIVYISPANSTVFQFAFESAYSTATWNESPEKLGYELRNYALNCIPDGCSHIQFYSGQLFASQYDQKNDQSYLWVSNHLAFHLFDLSSDFISLPGRITGMIRHAQGLIVGTDSRIYVYSEIDDTSQLQEIALFGLIDGHCTVADDDRSVLLLTQKGLCSALPLEKLTEHVSVDYGSTGSIFIVRKNGGKKVLVVVNNGGISFNEYQQQQ